MREGGWVFISHSHRDIDAVRKIRNEMERLGFEPLMFYLRCLSDDQEIEDLIKREISEREWFIYADSENARSSKWVSTEREYIESFGNKHIFTVDLNASLDEQLRRIAEITRQMKVFVAYSSVNTSLAQRVKSVLLKNDVLVCSSDDFSPDTSWRKTAKKSIGDASRDGFVLFLMTERWSVSVNMLYELTLAKKAGGKIFCVLLDGFEPTGELREQLKGIPCVRAGSNPTDEELNEIVQEMLSGVRPC